MSKIYIVDGRVVKEKDIHKIKFARQLALYELVEEIDPTNFFTNLEAQRERDNQLKAILDENGEYTNLTNFKAAFNKFVQTDEELSMGNPSWRPSNSKKHSVLAKFKEIGLDNIAMLNYLKANKLYFLMNVSSEVEYYHALLKVYNCTMSFKELKYVYVDRNLYKKEWKLVERFEIPKHKMDNFKEAKKLLKKK